MTPRTVGGGLSGAVAQGRQDTGAKELYSNWNLWKKYSTIGAGARQSYNGKCLAKYSDATTKTSL